MGGNVWEWCDDWWGKYDDKPLTDPRGPKGSARVLRGGAFNGDPLGLRAAFRYYVRPEDYYDDVGFRVVWLSAGEPK